MNLDEAKAAVRRWFNGEFYDWFRDADVGETLTLEVTGDFSTGDIKQIANVLYELKDEMSEESFDEGVRGRFYDSERGGYVEGRLAAQIMPDMGDYRTAFNYADGVLRITVGVTEVYSKNIDGGDYSEISSDEYYDLLSKMDPDEEYKIDLGVTLLAHIRYMLEGDE